MCRPIPGNHGSLTLFYARITDIAVGVIIVLLFDLVMPWFVIISTLAVHHGSPIGDIFRTCDTDQRPPGG